MATRQEEITKKIRGSAIALALLAAIVPAHAEDHGKFFGFDFGQWSTVGAYSDKGVPYCAAQTTWDDGRFLAAVRDLADDEFYIVYHHPKVELTNNHEMFGILEFSSNSSKSSFKISVEFKSPNTHTLHLRNMNYSTFMNSFIVADSLTMHYPGFNVSPKAGLDGSEKIQGLMNDCIKAHGKSIDKPRVREQRKL